MVSDRRDYGSEPALQVFRCDIRERLDVIVAVVEARNIGEMLAAGFLKALFDLFVDFLKRFDAIG